MIPTIVSKAYHFINRGTVLSPGFKFDSLREAVEVHCKEGYTKSSDDNLIFCLGAGKWYPENFDKFCWSEYNIS